MLPTAKRSLTLIPLWIIVVGSAIIFLGLDVTTGWSTTEEPEDRPSNVRGTITATVPPPPPVNETCPLEKLDPSFRTVTVEQSPRYEMYLHGPLKDKYISDSIFRSSGRNPFERHLQLLMEKQLRGRVPRNTTILDIGANIGLHSLNLASKGYVVHAFEPVPDNFNLLKCSRAANGGFKENLMLNNFGLSNEDADLCMKLNPDNQGGHQVNRGGECPADERVAIRRLDDYFEGVLGGVSPYMIKIDVEGHELLAFAGGERMFEAGDPPKLIFSEVTPFLFPTHNQTVGQFYDFFWKYDYKIYLVGSFEQLTPGSVIPSGQHDIVMVHSSIALVR